MIDGSLVENEGTLARLINAKLCSIAAPEGFTVGLLNDFQVPWVEQAGTRYPLYTQTFKFGRGRDDPESDEGDAANEDDDE